MNWTQEERSLYSSNTGRMDLGPSWATTSGRLDSSIASTSASTYSNGHSGSSSVAPSWSHEGEEDRLESLRLRKATSTVGRGPSPSSVSEVSSSSRPLPSWSHEAEEERLESLRQAKARNERNGFSSGGPPPSWSHEAEEERLEAVRKQKTRNDYSSTSTWGHDESLYDSTDNNYIGRPVNTSPPGQEECPFCMRYFSLSIIEKHVEQCMRLQESPPSYSSSSTSSSQRSYSTSNLNSSYYGRGDSNWEEEYGAVSSRSMRDDTHQLEEDERLARRLYEEENRKASAPAVSRHSSSSITTYSSSTPSQVYAPQAVPVYYPRYAAPMLVDRYVRYPRSYAPVPKIKYDENKRFILKQKGWMFGGDMYIKDTEDEELFRVKGRLLSLGTHLTICDLKRNPLVDIKQSFFIPKMPQFHVYQGENLGLHVKKKNKGRNDPDTFSVDSVIDGTRLKIVGEWYTYEYEIHRGTGAHAYPIATVARKQWNLFESYSVEVAAGEDALLILALCIIVDKIGHE